METRESFRKGAWSTEEDMLLRSYIEKFGEGKWHLISQRAGLNRCRKSCRLRWLNYLKPNINRSKFEADEVDLMKRLHKLLGNRWSLIAGRLPGRTANDVKNYWNTHIQKSGRKHKASCLGPCQNVYRPRPRSFTMSGSAGVSADDDDGVIKNMSKEERVPWTGIRETSSTNVDVELSPQSEGKSFVTGIPCEHFLPSCNGSNDDFDESATADSWADFIISDDMWNSIMEK